MQAKAKQNLHIGESVQQVNSKMSPGRQTETGDLSRILMSIGFSPRAAKRKEIESQTRLHRGADATEGLRSIPTLKGRTNKSMCKHFIFTLLSTPTRLYDVHDFYSLSREDLKGTCNAYPVRPINLHEPIDIFRTSYSYRIINRRIFGVR